ncbi:glutathione S-transferase family protein [Aurantiacibacter odishensis]|uniref:glutathione S-transferase family protein n=1 Tax=Aurantiacibacter odishensis TaxID=1155476 RepID=UPI000E7413F1|nr:glutathione S-transferase family protein [Aurantiacibacter odishensis]
MKPLLYFSPRSCSRVPLTALEEIGQPFETRLVALSKGEHRKPDFLAITPSGKVPALMTDDGLITQNGAILFYLAETYPEARLLPIRSTAAGRAHLLSMMLRCSSDLHPLVTRFAKPELISGEAANASQIRQQADEMLRMQLRQIDELLQKQEWYLEEGWSILDAYVAWIWFRITDAGFDPGGFTALSAHFTKSSQRPSSLAALAREQT